MIVVADTGALLAYYDRDDKHHRAVLLALKRQPVTIVVPSAILGELDYLLRAHLGAEAELAFVDALREGVYQLEELRPADLERCRDLLVTYGDLDIGLADAAVAAVAERLRAAAILTVDLRHFRALRSRGGEPFHLLPADAEQRARLTAG